jgi:hypothetical protein
VWFFALNVEIAGLVNSPFRQESKTESWLIGKYFEALWVEASA